MILIDFSKGYILICLWLLLAGDIQMDMVGLYGSTYDICDIFELVFFFFNIL